MKILYFAWLRERLGVEEEDVDLPSSVQTVSALLDWLAERGPEFAEVLEKRSVIRVAINQEHQPHDAKLEGATEIAIFPPVTGG